MKKHVTFAAGPRESDAAYFCVAAFFLPISSNQTAGHQWLKSAFIFTKLATETKFNATIFMYEHRTHSLLSPIAFLRRVARHIFFAFLILGGGLSIGVLGYHYLAAFGWVDSLLNASMILGGMGPVDPLTTTGAKLFASFYALFSGLAFVGIASFVLAPFVHRVLHRLHLEDKDQ